MTAARVGTARDGWYDSMMSVSERDREHMRRIGAYKAASHADAQARHRALTLEQRLQRSWALYEANRQALGRLVHEDPTPFYDRARALGLYRP
jgi:hypothetical protein